MSAKMHAPTEETRRVAEEASGLGLPQERIARLVGCSPPTLRLHYRDELDRGLAAAGREVASMVFNLARSGNPAATIFLAKVRLRWTERTAVEVPRGRKEFDLDALTDDQLVRLAAGLPLCDGDDSQEI